MGNSNKDSVNEFKDMLNVLDVANEVRRAQESAGELLDVNEKKEDIVSRLLETDRLQGGNLSRDQVEAAFDTYYSQKYDFTPAKNGVSKTLASVYLARNFIAKKIILPTVIATTIGVGAYFTIGAISEGIKTRAEETVENKIESAYKLKQKVDQAVSVYQEVKLDPRYASGALSLIALADEHTDATEPFFNEFIVNGSAKETITQDNYEAVDKQFSSIEDKLTLANSSIDDVDELSGLSYNEEKLYSSILSIVQEEDVKNSVVASHKEADELFASASVDKIKQLVHEMDKTYYSLDQEYDIIIYKGSKSMSGVERTHFDSNSKRYYLVVEAKDKQGKTLTQFILNEEDGTSFRANMWAERVPYEVYQRVGKDASDGIIDNNKFGYKQRGYITPKIVLEGVSKSQGRITRW